MYDEQYHETLKDPLRCRGGGLPAFLRRRSTITGIIVFLAALNVIQFIDTPDTRLRDYYGGFRSSCRSSAADARIFGLETGSGHDRDVDVKVPGKAIVLASYSKQDLAWTKDIPPSWTAYRYVLDDPTPRITSTPPPPNLSLQGILQNHTYTVPRNQGREAMAYLTYIIDHYHNLPLFTVFLHGHDKAWHQIEHAADKLRALNLTAVALAGYANIRCTEAPNCLPEKVLDLSHGADGVKYIPHRVLPGFWQLIFPHGPAPPARLAAVGTAQMAVTREAIRARPLEFWKSLRRPLERDLKEVERLLPDLVPAGHDTFMQGGQNYAIGLLYERLWPVFFGMPSEYCPGEDYCRQEVFSDAFTCDRYIGEVRESNGWQEIPCKVDENAVKRAAREQDRAVQAASLGA